MDIVNEIKETKRKGLVEFTQAVFSDGDVPSSSRILTFVLSLADLGIVAAIFHHVFSIKDSAALSLWLNSLPIIIGALVGMSTAPYVVNRGSGTVTDILSIFKR